MSETVLSDIDSFADRFGFSRDYRTFRDHPYCFSAQAHPERQFIAACIPIVAIVRSGRIQRK
jgi:hypothetical protein